MPISEAVLQCVRSGALDFNDFARTSRGDFIQLAGSVMRGFPGMYSVEADDLVQVMLMTTMHSVRAWNPEQGYPLQKFVVWHACNSAKRMCRRQVKSLQVVLLPPLRALDANESDETAPAWQELELEVVEILRDLPTNRRQVAVLNSVFETQCMDRTLDELMRDPATRLMFGAGREAARRGIYRTMTRLTKRAQGLAR